MKRIYVLLALMLLMSFTEGAAQSRRTRYAPHPSSWRFAIEGGVGALGDDNTRDSRDYHFRPIGGLEIAKLVNQHIIIGMYAGGGTLRSSTPMREANTDFMVAGLLAEFRALLLQGALCPLIQVRGGALAINPELRMNNVTYSVDRLWHISGSAAAGFEAISWKRFGVRALFGVAYTSTDRWDLLVQGDDRDGYSFVELGITWYFTFRR